MKKILSLLALLMVAFTTAWAGDVKVTWTTGASGGYDTAAEPATAAGDIKYSVGEGLKENGTTTCDDVVFVKFDQNTGSEKGANGKHDQNVTLGKYVDFTFTPVGGDFTPTKVSFDIIKVGTGDPAIDVDVVDASGKTIAVASNVTIRKNSETTPSMSQSFDVSGAQSGNGAVTLRIIPGKLASGKAIAIANVVIEGTLVSSDAPVLSATKELNLKVTPLTPGMKATATIALTGKNLTDGTYNTPVPAEEAITITPEQFTVTDGIVNQEFNVTYKPVSSVTDGFTKVFFEIGDLSAAVDISYNARLEAYEQTIVSEETTWNWEDLTETIELNETTVPSINDEFVFKELEDQINFGSFDAQSIVISKTQYPVRNKKFQNGTIKFTTDRPGVITVDFSDTGSSGDGVKRYLNVNGNDTEYYTQRDGSSDRKVSGEIAVPAGEVAITGWDPEAEIKDADGNVIGTGKNVAICIYKVTFTPTGEPVDMIANIAALKGFESDSFDPVAAVLTLKNAKVGFVTTKESTDFDDDWNEITVQKDYVLIEDASAGYLLEGSGLGDYVKAGDVLNGTLAIDVEIGMYGTVLAKLTNGIQGVTVTASEVQPIVVSDDNIMDYLADNDFRLAQFNDAVINIVDNQLAFSATVMGDDPIDIQDTYRIIPETIADGTKGTLTGYMASLYGMTFFIPTAFVENVSDNINAVNAIVGNDAVIFNMQGQRVAQPVKGINIINGKKVVFK